MGKLWNWLTGRRPSTAPTEVILYTRQGCHLCVDALAVLEVAGRRYVLAIQSVDVDSDPELAARYGLEVPVVVVLLSLTGIITVEQLREWRGYVIVSP